jgi:NAD(P)-dependent dehydrogenase (short-subunit alcohol dehydrogenase family)
VTSPLGTSGPLAGRTVVITGAGRGLGLAMARACALDGADVVGVDVDGKRMADAVALLAAEGLSVVGRRCDICDEADVEDVFAGLTQAPWAVVNNAALADGVGGKPFWEIEAADWERVVRVNLDGTWLFSKHAARAMIPAGSGRFVNLSSDAAFYGSPRLAHYIASKGAIVALTRGMARELGPHGITVNAIAPGLTEGPSAETIPQERHDLYAGNRALERPQVPEDIVGLTTFLLSEHSSYITGQTIVVDGGFVMP